MNPMALSEALRETDALIASTGTGRTAPEPGFPPGFDWEALAFGPLGSIGRTRRDVLARVLPRTTLAARCRLDDRWLVVDGAQGEARIHLESGRVQVAGADRPVEPGKKAVEAAKRAFLPFEGDPGLPHMLAIAHAWVG